ALFAGKTPHYRQTWRFRFEQGRLNAIADFPGGGSFAFEPEMFGLPNIACTAISGPPDCDRAARLFLLPQQTASPLISPAQPPRTAARVARASLVLAGSPLGQAVRHAP